MWPCQISPHRRLRFSLVQRWLRLDWDRFRISERSCGTPRSFWMGPRFGTTGNVGSFFFWGSHGMNRTFSQCQPLLPLRGDGIGTRHRPNCSSDPGQTAVLCLERYSRIQLMNRTPHESGLASLGGRHRSVEDKILFRNAGCCLGIFLPVQGSLGRYFPDRGCVSSFDDLSQELAIVLFHQRSPLEGAHKAI